MATPRQPREARSRTAQTRVRRLVSPGSRPVTLVRLVRVAAAKAGTASILAVPGEYAVPASWVQSLRVFSAMSARISAPGTIR